MRCGSRRRRPWSGSGFADAAGVAVVESRSHQTSNRVQGRRHPGRSAFRAASMTSDTTSPDSSGAGQLHFTMKPNSRTSSATKRSTGARDHRAPGQRAGRRRTDRRAIRRPRSDPRAAAGCQRRRPRQGDHQVDGAAQADAGRTGAVPDREAALAGLQQRAPRWRSCRTPRGGPPERWAVSTLVKGPRR